jgi:hypothetical protein
LPGLSQLRRYIGSSRFSHATMFQTAAGMNYFVYNLEKFSLNVLFYNIKRSIGMAFAGEEEEVELFA